MGSEMCIRDRFIYNNSFNGIEYGIFGDGENSYNILKNDFNVSTIGSFLSSTGSNFNTQAKNSFNSDVGIHCTNDNSGYIFIENCFDSYSEDVNIYGSIEDDIGDSETGAGNCFSGGNTTDITSSLGSFTYYVPPSELSTCRYPTNQSNYTIDDAEDNNSLECGSSQTYEPTNSQLCYGEITDCSSLINQISQIWQSISEIENNNSLSPSLQASLTHRYRRCLIYLIKRRAKLCGHSVFQQLQDYEDYRVKASLAGIMIARGELTDAETYLNSLSPINQEVQDFIDVQRINIERIRDGINFNLTTLKHQTIRNVALKTDPLSAYARGLLFQLTGEEIKHSNHIVSNRSKTKDMIFKNKYEVFPNPSIGNVNLNVTSKDNAEYEIEIVDVTGIAFFKYQGNKKNHNIDTSNWSKGLYYILIESLDEERKILKLNVL